MPVRLHFEMFGSTQIDRTLQNLEKVADMRPAWAELKRRFLNAERRQFSSEGAYGGARWSPLSPAYGAWKARHAPGKPILQLSGELMRSLTQGPEIDVEEPSYAIFGSAVDYGRYHQHGTPRMPKRPPIALTEAERQEWVRVVQRFLVTGHAR
jgi:phage gpG-like protein